MDWPLDPLTGGGYSFPRPGQIMSTGRLLYHGLGRLHFCGEHTSYKFVGYMEGGLNSGVSLAQRISKRDSWWWHMDINRNNFKARIWRRHNQSRIECHKSKPIIIIERLRQNMLEKDGHWNWTSNFVINVRSRWCRKTKLPNSLLRESRDSWAVDNLQF